MKLLPFPSSIPPLLVENGAIDPPPSSCTVSCRKLCHSPGLKSKALLLLIYSSLRCLHVIETNKSGHRNEDLRIVSLSFNAFDLFPTFYLHRKPHKKKGKKKIKNEKPPTQRKPSMRWKNIRLVVGEDR